MITEIKIQAFEEGKPQQAGLATYGPNGKFTFSPFVAPAVGVKSFRKNGVAEQADDGTFGFVAVPRKHTQSTLIKKLPHGRLSLTADGAIQLTLKFPVTEPRIAAQMARESDEAVKACLICQTEGRRTPNHPRSSSPYQPYVMY